ncbi:nucleoside triphosphate pyrophosphohydrolase [bacterium]|nr:nucleoside triphosphate pyrophosphohydrolase [bacterium]
MSKLDELLETMRALRAKNGCPWDREQTLDSLKPFLLEEAYELIDAIDSKDIENHKEELGDVLLQLVFQAQIRDEEGLFSFQDVADYINKKMIHRHPHVFKNDKTIETSSDVLNKWDSFKKAEGKKITFFGNIPNSFPALLESLKINIKAAKTGFDWEKIDDIYEKLDEELLEFKSAKTDEERVDELGDILFVIVNLARRHNINPEEALKRSNKKFKNRFELMLELAKEKKLDFSDLSLDEMDKLWDEIKIQIKNSCLQLN